MFACLVTICTFNFTYWDFGIYAGLRSIKNVLLSSIFSTCLVPFYAPNYVLQLSVRPSIHPSARTVPYVVGGVA